MAHRIHDYVRTFYFIYSDSLIDLCTVLDSLASSHIDVSPLCCLITSWPCYFFFFFNWRIVALQYCVGCCHISTWISHKYTYVPSLFNFPPTSHSIPSLYVVTGPSFWVPWVMQKISAGWLSILHVVVYTFPCYSLHLSHCLIPPLHVHKSVLLVCVSTAALQIGSSLPSFQITYVCVNIRDLFFWLISLCIIGSGF